MSVADACPAVRQALERAVELGEAGVAVAAYVDEELAIDEWIGCLSDDRDAPVGRDTLFPIFSVTKVMTATAVHLQAERGLVDYEAPVASYWPEFGQGGKGGITVRHVLCHQSGMVAMPAEATPELVADWEWVTSRLAAMSPLHPPGEANAYHAQSFGWLIGEVVRRTDPDHRPLCRFLRDEIFAPFGIDDVWLPLPPEQDHRVATLLTGGAPQPDFSAARFRDVSTPSGIAPIPAVHNRPEMRRVCGPSAGAIATARDVARFFAILANGGVLHGRRLLSEQRVRSFLQVRPHNDRIDEVGGARTSVGIGGFWVRDPKPLDGSDASGLPKPVLGSSPNVLYHTGAGGTLAFADLDRRVSVAICHNRMFGTLPVDRHPWVDLVTAILEWAR